jgi:ankyrin repeat protein
MSPKNKLDTIQIPSPCTADWDSMVGNRQVRFCEHCHLSVHNLSAMTRDRALRLVANSHGRLCVRFVPGDTGRPITNLPLKFHRIGRRVSRLTAGVFTAALSLSSAAAQSGSQPTPTRASAEQSVPAPEQKPVETQALSASVKGTISTIVADTEKPVVGASVTLTNQDTGAELITSSTEDGAYSFPSVGPGNYTLSVHAAGYEESNTKGLTVRNNSAGRRDVTLFPEKEEGDGPVRVQATAGVMVMVEPTGPLVAAAYRDDLVAMKELLFQGSDANVFDETTQTSALDRAVENGNREMVQLLLSSHARANGDAPGSNPLMYLRNNATQELVLDLIAAGAYTNQQDETGDTPLMYAASISNLVAVKTLIKMGATVNTANNAGTTPLMKGAANDDPNVVNLMLELGADVNAHDDDGETALLVAAANHKPAIIKLLLKAGAKANVQDKQGKSPLLAAAAEDDEDVVKLLLAAGADVDVHDHEGETPLMVAVSEAPVEVVKLFIDAGAKLDLRNKDGQTALMRAAIAGDERSAQLLIAAGADFKLRDKDGKTALDLARDRETAEVIAVLVAHGAPD